MRRPAVLALLLAACATGGTPPSTTIHPAGSGERHLRNIRQLTFEGNNAEAYWSSAGDQLVFQRRAESLGIECDRIFLLGRDAPMRQISNGRGRTTCAYFLPGDRRVLYSSTHLDGDAPPAPPDRSQGYVWGLFAYEVFSVGLDGKDPVRPFPDLSRL